MPTITVNRDALFERLGQRYADEEFDELCFQFGIELDEVAKELVGNKEEIVYKIEIPANRYDMLCIEGISRALRIFLEKESTPVYRTILPPADKLEKIVVKPETNLIRPFIVGAILRNVKMNQLIYDSLIDLQDKLHNNICRRRTLVAIGTHDLDTIKGPFTYEALAPTSINFKPLNQTKEMRGDELMKFYESDMKLKKFLHIIRDSPVYPVVKDSNGVVLSLPPIINGDHSKITLNTKNIFIECTATDLTKAKIVLDTIVTMFSEYTAEKFSVEQVEVVSPTQATNNALYPDLSLRTTKVDIPYIHRLVGVQLPPAKIAELLTRMSLKAVLGDNNDLVVEVPPTRSDVLHACDVMEDVAIAYGFNNLPKTIPKTNTVAAMLPINKLSDLLRREVALAGWSEVLTLSLCSHDENFAFLKRKDAGDEAVVIANPKTVEFEVARTSLLPGIFKTVSCNQNNPLPIRVFEISDVVLKDPKMDVGARNERRLSAAYFSTTSGFETIHGLLDRLMLMLNVKQGAKGSSEGYYIVPSDVPTYFPDRQADIYVNGQKIGHFGVVHPEVLSNFEIPYPGSAIEMNIEPFL